MKKAIVTLWGKYKYPVMLDDNMSFHDAALAISLAVHKKEGKTKFTGKPRSFNYVYECLLRKSCLNFRLNSDSTVNNEQEMLTAANELNSKSGWIQVGDHYEKQEYRLGYTQNKVLIIDIDGKDMDNIFNIKQYYEGVLNCKFTTIATKNGYWIFSDKKYNDLDSWVFDHCKVLHPQLKRADFHSYKEQLLKLDENKQGDFKRATPEIIKASGLYHAPKVLSFDIAFTFLSIKRERSTIRYTKKSKDDKIEVIS
jgi:hypothetical protein